MNSATAERAVGDWVLEQKIGSGSFAIVWRARHRVSGALAAVKEIETERMNRKLQESLASEMAVLEQTRHENVVQLLDVKKEDSKFFIVLEYCSGGDLANYIKRHGPVGEATSRYLLQHLAEGLKELRLHNVIHRDLKPQNLLLSSRTSRPFLKIADFGFARSLQPQGLAETLCGSPLYMAPEILQFHKYDAKADLWSVGTILYELLVGKPPFNGANHMQLLRNIERQEAKIPDSVARDLSPACQDLIRQLLKRNPVERISFEEFFAHPFLSGMPTKPGSRVQPSISSTVPQVPSVSAGPGVQRLEPVSADEHTTRPTVLNPPLLPRSSPECVSTGVLESVGLAATPLKDCSPRASAHEELVESFEHDYVVVSNPRLSEQSGTSGAQAEDPVLDPLGHNKTGATAGGHIEQALPLTPLQMSNPPDMLDQEPPLSPALALAYAAAPELAGDEFADPGGPMPSREEILLETLKVVLTMVKDLQSSSRVLDRLALHSLALKLVLGAVSSEQEESKAVLMQVVRDVVAGSKEVLSAGATVAEDTKLPDPMELLYDYALVRSRSAGADELMGSFLKSAEGYQVGSILFLFLVTEGPQLVGGREPWSPSEQHHLHVLYGLTRSREKAARVLGRLAGACVPTST